MLLQQWIENEIRNKIQEYAQSLGGLKANGEPWTDRDTDETFARVKERMNSGQVQVLERSHGGVIVHRGH